jgi:two-component system chemotaxis response regulator CheB
MDGLTTLKHLMIHTPTPTVMLSSLSRDGAKITFDALRYGAIDFITKPSHLDPYRLKEKANAMINTVKYASSVEMGIMHYIRPEFNLHQNKNELSYKFVVAMGAAEGGYSSLLTLLLRLSLNNPLSYLVVLYASLNYIDSFIHYLDQHSAIRVKRAEHGDILQAGVCYICSGDEYMTLHDNDLDQILHLHPAPFASQKSAINRLMFSLADIMDSRGIGIVLSGAGDDGHEGLEEVKRMGGYVMVQDPKNCLYKEMSESVIDHCEVDGVFSAAKIADNLNAYY